MSEHVIVGRLTQEPRIIYTDNGICITNFTLAENVYMGKDKDNKPKYEPIFHRCVAFGSVAEKIGNDSIIGRVYIITAQSIPDNYINKEGKKVYSSKYKALTVQFGAYPKAKKAEAANDQKKGTLAASNKAVA